LVFLHLAKLFLFLFSLTRIGSTVLSSTETVRITGVGHITIRKSIVNAHIGIIFELFAVFLPGLDELIRLNRGAGEPDVIADNIGFFLRDYLA